MELLFGFVYAFPVLAVDDEHETLGASVVVPPEGPDLVLTSDVPHVELDILVGHRLDVKPNYALQQSRMSEKSSPYSAEVYENTAGVKTHLLGWS